MSQTSTCRLGRIFTALLLIVLIQACGREQPPVEQPAVAPPPPVVKADTAFVNVNVISMTSEAPLQGQTVLVSNGVISGMAPSGSISLSPKTKIIEGKGRYLMPALTDMHDHIIGPETLKLQVAWGVTTVRNMFGSPDALKWRDAVAAGNLFGPEIITGSPLIDNDPPYFPGSALLTRPEDADAFVADMKAQGYSFLKPYELLEEDVYIAMMQAADRHGMHVEGHIPQSVSVDQAIELGQDSAEHGMRIDAAILADGIPWGASFQSREMVNLVARIEAGELTWEEAFSRDKLRALSRRMAQSGLAMTVTMNVVTARANANADRERMASHPKLKYVPPMFRGFWLKPITEDSELVTEGVMVKLSDEEVDSLKYYSTVEYGQWIKIMHEEGVLILGGVDAPNPGMFHGYSLHEELQRLVRLADLSPFEAIKTATVNPAIHWGQEGSRGIVAEGAEADLLLVAANPLDDIDNTLAIEGVMMNGQWHDRGALDALLLSVEQAYAVMPAMPGGSSAGDADESNEQAGSSGQ
jgi:imidazolonepropionase-like amidohydrolase